MLWASALGSPYDVHAIVSTTPSHKTKSEPEGLHRFVNDTCVMHFVGTNAGFEVGLCPKGKESNKKSNGKEGARHMSNYASRRGAGSIRKFR